MDKPSLDDQIAAADLEEIGRLALDDQRASVAPEVKVEPILATHNDSRTEALVRVLGHARVRSNEAQWSAVLKVIDMEGVVDAGLVWINPK